MDLEKSLQIISSGKSLTPREITEVIFKIEKDLLKLPQVELPVTHHFGDGVYAREMKVKAGTLLTGRVHLLKNLNILSEGEASVISIDGAVRIKAPFTYVGSAGAKRLIFAHTDITWTTILGTTEIDPVVIEETYTTNSMPAEEAS